MFDYENDPVYQFMLYEFVAEQDEDVSDDEDEVCDITFSIELTYDPDADPDADSG